MTSVKMLAVLLLGTATAVVMIVVSPLARADGDGGSGSCNIYQPSCTVDAGGGGGPAGHGSGSSGSGASVDPCAKYPNAGYGDTPPKVSQACADELQANYCSAMAGDSADALGKPPAQWKMNFLSS